MFEKAGMEIQTKDKKDEEKPIVELSNNIKVISNYSMEVGKMKKKMIVIVAILLLLTSIALPIVEVHANRRSN